jgi:hypothetical protein
MLVLNSQHEFEMKPNNRVLQDVLMCPNLQKLVTLRSSQVLMFCKQHLVQSLAL